MVTLTAGIFSAHASRPPSPAQLRGARSMLGWSILRTAQAARVSVAVVMRVEQDLSKDQGDSAIASLQQAFEAAGIRFLNEDGADAGLRLSVP